MKTEETLCLGETRHCHYASCMIEETEAREFTALVRVYHQAGKREGRV